MEVGKLVIPMNEQTEKLFDSIKKAVSNQNMHDSILSLIDSVDEIILCSKEHIPLAQKSEKENQEKIKDEIKDMIEKLKDETEREKFIGKVINSNLEDVVQSILKNRKKFKAFCNERSNILMESLFIYFFSVFDTFVSQLIKCIYFKKPELFDKTEKKFSFHEIVTFDSINDFRINAIEKEIEAFRRDSYVEQFKSLENKYGIKTLRKFENWPLFVECAQRRNLITHCNGILSEQYYSVCQEEKLDIGEEKVGDKLTIDLDYLLQACTLVKEVGVKLGQTLWRKIFPEEIEDADVFLHFCIYNLLTEENYNLAILLGEFALNQPRVFNDAIKKLYLMNYCIALKFSNQEEKAKQLMLKEDWSSSIDDFKLAKNVLLDNEDESVILLKKIGKKGEYLREDSYKDWPLFKNFRTKKSFHQVYFEVYGKKLYSEIENELLIELEKMTDQ